jgi:hypothetical protein
VLALQATGRNVLPDSTQSKANQPALPLISADSFRGPAAFLVDGNPASLVGGEAAVIRNGGFERFSGNHFESFDVDD